MKELKISPFEKEITEGLMAPQKKLSSKYFYDEEGDRLFQEIMKLKEYYLPEAELEILKEKAAAIAEDLSCKSLDILELGAGDGSKSVFFLENLIRLGKEVKYVPLDISENILRINKQNMAERLPEMEIEPHTGDYFQTMKVMGDQLNTKLVMFMGSNIGNYKEAAAIEFLRLIYENLHFGDYFMMGVDLRKNPKTILAAYNDSKGVTKAFNLNLLKRINRELGADFDLDSFDHYPFYDPVSGTTFSYLVSLKNQTVHFESGTQIPFKKNELIHTEVSKKYSLKEIEGLGRQAGFSFVSHHLDARDYFSVSLFQKSSNSSNGH
ncbi:L-histidine N(alpha)-methyltransferase [Pararhodonellum marinum]|uniref:L-histidine N(alpha)-methyltransferase n=1 Tax=Pararhodonellum marinum TaxID=2755358 RepID=UPI0018903CD1|nr:L-histidine N(alpha)-methyltransferase [Pararhodonellum marinum]